MDDNFTPDDIIDSADRAYVRKTKILQRDDYWFKVLEHESYMLNQAIAHYRAPAVVLSEIPAENSSITTYEAVEGHAQAVLDILEDIMRKGYVFP